MAAIFYHLCRSPMVKEAAPKCYGADHQAAITAQGIEPSGSFSEHNAVSALFADAVKAA
jgi:hypothetical protein